MLWAPQVPLVMRETFGEVPGLRRPIGSGPRPAQIWEPEIAILVCRMNPLDPKIFRTQSFMTDYDS